MAQQGTAFGADAGQAEDYYDFVPSDDELSDEERSLPATPAAPLPSSGSSEAVVAAALAATTISSDRAIFAPIGATTDTRKHQQQSLPPDVVARRGSETVRVSPESMAQHSARKADLLSALDGCFKQNVAADRWGGDAPFRFASSRADTAASPAPSSTAVVEVHAPQPSGKKMSSRVATGGDDEEDDDPLYDDQMDDADESWVHSNFRGARVKTDAALCCPCCFVTVCMDCQRHEKYNQYRASTAVNCRVVKSEVLTYVRSAASEEAMPFQKRVDQRASGTNAGPQILGPDEYYPVACSDCSTTVGVFDRKQQFHFFNVLPSNC